MGKVILGMIMALAMNQPVRGRGGIRVAMILPWTIPTIVSVFAWQWIYSDVGGALNRILMVLHITDHQIGWLSTTSMAMFSVILVRYGEELRLLQYQYWLDCKIYRRIFTRQHHLMAQT